MVVMKTVPNDGTLYLTPSPLSIRGSGGTDRGYHIKHDTMLDVTAYYDAGNRPIARAGFPDLVWTYSRSSSL